MVEITVSDVNDWAPVFINTTTVELGTPVIMANAAEDVSGTL